MSRLPDRRRHPHAKLTDEQVYDLRVRFAGGEKLQALADAYGVHIKTARKTVQGERYKDVAFPPEMFVPKPPGTFCKNGHEITEGSYLIYERGWKTERRCRACLKAQNEKQKERRRNARRSYTAAAE